MATSPKLWGYKNLLGQNILTDIDTKWGSDWQDDSSNRQTEWHSK